MVFISPNVVDSILPSSKIQRNENERNSFQVSSANVFPDSVKKYAFRFLDTPFTWACLSISRPWSFKPAIALGTFERAIATAFAIPICDNENGTSTLFL